MKALRMCLALALSFLFLTSTATHVSAAPPQAAAGVVAAPYAPGDDGEEKKDKESVADKVCKYGFWTPAMTVVCTGKKVIEKGPAGAAADAVKAASDSLMGPFAESARAFVSNLIKKGMTFWLEAPSISISGSGVLGSGSTGITAGATGTESISLHGIMLGIGMMVAVLMAILQGIRTAIQRKSTPLIQLLQGFFVNMLVVSIGVGIIDALLVATDKLTKAILDVGMAGDAPERMVAMLLPSIGNPVGLAFIALIVLIIGGAQLVLLFLRQAAIPIQALLLPIAGAGQMGGDTARQWLPRLVTAILCIIFYKPVAALIFSVGFIQVENSDATIDWLRGVVTLALAIVALKALMAIFAPIGEKMGGAVAAGGGFAGALATAGAAFAVGGGAGATASSGPVTAQQQAGFMEANGPGSGSGGGAGGAGGKGGDDSAEGSSARKQSEQPGPTDSGRQADVPTQRPGESASSDGASGAAGGSGARSGGGAAAGAGGAVNVALVAAEAGQQTADRAGQAMGKGE